VAVRTRVGHCFRLSIDRFSIEDKIYHFGREPGRTQAADAAATVVGGDMGGLGAWVYLSRVCHRRRRRRRRRRRPKLVPYEWAPATTTT